MDPAAHNAIAALGVIHEQAREALEQLRRLIREPQTVEQMVADPDSPVNIARTLATVRNEAAAQREALRPFAMAYTRLADQLGDIQIPVFTDAIRPEKSSFVYLADFKRAQQAYKSYSIGAETVDRIDRYQADLRRAAELLALWLSEDGPMTEQDLADCKDIAERYQKRKP